MQKRADLYETLKRRGPSVYKSFCTQEREKIIFQTLLKGMRQI